MELWEPVIIMIRETPKGIIVPRVRVPMGYTGADQLVVAMKL
jgi:hypothetical protein